MSNPQTIEITSCALGGHLLGRGDAVKKQLEEEYPEATIENKKRTLVAVYSGEGWQRSNGQDFLPRSDNNGGAAHVLQIA